MTPEGKELLEDVEHKLHMHFIKHHDPNYDGYNLWSYGEDGVRETLTRLIQEAEGGKGVE